VSNTPINDQWLEYAATIFRSDVPPPPAHLLAHSKKTFFAGAYAVYSIQVQSHKKGGEAAFHALMKSIEAEFGRLIREMTESRQ